MSIWFRRPKPEVVDTLGYVFWFKEGYANLFANTKGHFKDGEYWDLRFWLQIPLIPFWFIFAPFLCIGLKKMKKKEIAKGHGMTLSNQSNIELFKRLNEEI